MAKILGLPFDSYVDKQINVRQAKLAKTQKAPEDLVVFNSNTAWVRLTSGVKIEPDRAKTLASNLNTSVNEVAGTALARNLVLWNGVSSFATGSNSAVLEPLKGGVGYGVNNAYGFLTSTDQGLKPPPGITGISSAYKNNGSLRQAQVSIKCYSRSQFEALEAIYLRLGYTVVLEWGNTVWFDNEGEIQQTRAYSIPNLLYKSDDNIDPETIQSRLKENKENTACNYDGMLARVSNYSWNLNEDLSFDIKLDLISVGDIIDSLKANLAGSAGTISLQVETSGSIQNIVNIVVNKEVSKVNKLFYEMYDEVFKGLLAKFGSEETKKVVAVADNVEKSTPLVNIVKTKYLPLFEKLREPLVKFRRLQALWDGPNPIGNNPEWVELAKSFNWDPILGEGVTSLGRADEIVSNTTVRETVTEYETKVNKLEEYFKNLKAAEDENGTAQLDFLNRNKYPLVNLIRALETGHLDPEGKFILEGVKYSGSTIDNAWDTALQSIFFGGAYGPGKGPDF